MILDWLGSLLEWLQVVLKYVIIRLKSTVIKVVIGLTIFAFLLWLAIFMYASFHYVYMPSNVHVKQVHFEYDNDVECQKDVKLKSSLCSFPSANLSLLKRGQDQILMPGQAYTISLILEMPESPVNQDLGMFIIKLDLYGRKGYTLQDRKRSGMIRFKSSLLQTIETITIAPFYLMGMKEQKQDLIIRLHDHFEDNAYNPTVGALVRVQSKDIQIYSAFLKIHAKMTGLRYLIFEYPVLASFFGITSNLCFLIAVTLLSWYKVTVMYNNGQEDKMIPTLEERRRALRATMHRERTRSTPTEVKDLPEDDNAERPVTLRKMTTSSHRRVPSSPQLRNEEPEVLSAGQDDQIEQVNSTAPKLTVTADSETELRKRKSQGGKAANDQEQNQL